MSPEDQDKLKHLLTAEMVSRVSLAEAVNIMHNLAVSEVATQVEKMSDEEKEEAFKELSQKLEGFSGEKSPEEKEEAE